MVDLTKGGFSNYYKWAHRESRFSLFLYKHVITPAEPSFENTTIKNFCEVQRKTLPSVLSAIWVTFIVATIKKISRRKCAFEWLKVLHTQRIRFLFKDQVLFLIILE